MGREIRRVKPGWQHPVNDRCNHYGRNPHDGGPCYRPMHDQDYETAALEWCANYAEFMAMTPEQQAEKYGKYIRYYWEYDGTPDEEYYRAERWTPEEATAYQVYETVSEGTPVSPVFATEDEMRQWLIQQGHSEYAVGEFLKHQWAPSMVMQEGRGVSGIGIDSYDFDMPESTS
jgi:hypothetical protein